MPIYGQVVVGPPGSGKTTYCNGMQQYCRLIGREDTLVINLDPANEVGPRLRPPDAAGAQTDADTSHDGEGRGREGVDEGNGEGDGGGGGNEQQNEQQHALPYDTLLDVCEEVVNLSSVMDELNLGPNGGLMYCMEYVEHHLDHVLSLIKARIHPRTTYLLIDLPGQVELYTHCTCVQTILSRLTKELDLRLTAVNLVDAHYCADASKFISAALLSTTAMLRLELPAVNVLSKIDLINKYGSLPYNLDFFTDCHDLDRLVPYLEGGGGASEDGGDDGIGSGGAPGEGMGWEDDPEYVAARAKTRASRFYRRRVKLHEALCEVVDDFGLLRYVPLDITDAASVGRVLARVDKANGYVFLGSTTSGGGGGRDGVGGGAAGDSSNANDDDVRDMFRCAIQAEGGGWEYEQLADVQERFLGMFCESIPELEKERQKQKGEGVNDDRSREV